MKTVIISGSRNLSQLNPDITGCLDKIMSLKLSILIGDCYGVDTLVQRYLKKHNYSQVKVYHIGQSPRNNLGFTSVKVQGNRYQDKDIIMCRLADYGLAIWDGKSLGTKANIERVKLTRIIKL